MTHWLQALLQWFAIHQRQMPWRDDPSPYKVWISEIMLQQTRVAAVIPYFERFIATFPDVHHLAAAPQERVLKAWEGLGYYSRARNLHAAAQIISTERQGVFPTSESEWRELPGVGPYTAAAVASIAHKQPAAAIDGNVMRVWSRMRGIREDISAPSWREKARQDLIRYARKCDPSRFNQALMELGALVCLPRNPACSDCPLRTNCVAARKNWTTEIPYRKPKTKNPHKHEIVLLIEFQGSFLMRQRPDKGLLASLWEFPATPSPELSPGEYRKRARAFAESFHVPANLPLHSKSSIEHAFTHFRQTLHIFQVQLNQPISLKDDQWIWCNAYDRKTLPLSRTQRQIANQITPA